MQLALLLYPLVVCAVFSWLWRRSLAKVVLFFVSGSLAFMAIATVVPLVYRLAVYGSPLGAAGLDSETSQATYYRVVPESEATQVLDRLDALWAIFWHHVPPTLFSLLVGIAFLFWLKSGFARK